MPQDCLALANNAVVYLVWRLSEKIPDCLGFSVHRIAPDGSRTVLPAHVGFDAPAVGQPRRRRTTDEWPVQAFQWKDVRPSPGNCCYEVIPMLGPAPHALRPHPSIRLRSNPVQVGGDFGDVAVYFNLGLIAAQDLRQQLRAQVDAGQHSSTAAALMAAIHLPGSSIRQHLCGELLERALLPLLQQAATHGGGCHLALHELSDDGLVDAILDAAQRRPLALCLANADRSQSFGGMDGKRHTRRVFDQTNAAARARLRRAGVAVCDRFLAAPHVAHNRFVIWSDPSGPQHVLTGSTNWSAIGLCAQTQNALIIRSRRVAGAFKQYWDRLAQDSSRQPPQSPTLRAWCGGGTQDAPLARGRVSVWFSPNTRARTKNPAQLPPDLAQVYGLIRRARHGILFLTCQAGAPSVVEEVQRRSAQLARQGRRLYVRGAVTDAAPMGPFATFLTRRNACARPELLVSGLAGVPDEFGAWEKELYRHGQTMLNDQILVIDPFSADCCVVTGSHALGFAASFHNDDNLVIIRGHGRLAQAYAAHVLDVTNHLSWRCKLSQAACQGSLDQAWSNLCPGDHWQDKYFDPLNDAAHDAQFFWGNGLGLHQCDSRSRTTRKPPA